MKSENIKMWTEREKYLTDFDKIRNFLQEEYSFHDYRIGFLCYEGTQARITIEDDTPNQKPSDNNGLIWDFDFEGVESFVIDSDCVTGFWIDEIRLEEGSFIFSCTNGSILVKAKNVKIGIPRKDQGK